MSFEFSRFRAGGRCRLLLAHALAASWIINSASAQIEQRLPNPVSDVSVKPYSDVGLVSSSGGSGSGFVLKSPRVILSAAHVFHDDDGNLEFQDATWHRQHHGQFFPLSSSGIPLRRIWSFTGPSGYGAMVAENGVRDLESFNIDIVAIHGYQDLGDGENADFYLDGREALRSEREKKIIGYPSSLYDDVVRPSSSSSRYRMHETNSSFTPYSAGMPASPFFLRVLSADKDETDLISAPGNSGGAAMVQDEVGNWRVAGVTVAHQPHLIIGEDSEGEDITAGRNGASALREEVFRELVDPALENSSLPPSPTGLRASDGTQDFFVRILWYSIDGAGVSELFRNTINSTTGAEMIYAGGSTFFDDRTIDLDIVYYYFVRARIGDTVTGLSAGESGFVADKNISDLSLSNFEFFPLRLKPNDVPERVSYRITNEGPSHFDNEGQRFLVSLFLSKDDSRDPFDDWIRFSPWSDGSLAKGESWDLTVPPNELSRLIIPENVSGIRHVYASVVLEPSHTEIDTRVGNNSIFLESPILIAKSEGAEGLRVEGEADLVNDGTEFQGFIYNGFQLVEDRGVFASEPGTITRVSMLDPGGDLIFFEFGSDNPATTMEIIVDEGYLQKVPSPYNQEGVTYTQGLASVTIRYATELTFISVFSLGNDPNRINLTLINAQSFPENADDMADIKKLSIESIDGKVGGINLANANLTDSSECSPNETFGLIAESIQHFCFLGDITYVEGGGIPTIQISPDSPIDQILVSGGDFFESGQGNEEAKIRTLGRIYPFPFVVTDAQRSIANSQFREDLEDGKIPASRDTILIDPDRYFDTPGQTVKLHPDLEE